MRNNTNGNPSKRGNGWILDEDRVVTLTLRVQMLGKYVETLHRAAKLHGVTDEQYVRSALLRIFKADPLLKGRGAEAKASAEAPAGMIN